MKRIMFTLLFGMGVINSAAAVEGNVEAGKAKSGVCAACHGADGISAIPNYPNLAGQNAPYIVKQLEAFKTSSTRSDAVMGPMAAGLSEQDMADLGAYFSSLSSAPAAAEPVASTTETAAPTGAVEIAHSNRPSLAGGNVEAGKTKSAMCAACHGADGNSLVAMYPKIAGQSAVYIAKQLADFKEGVDSAGKAGRVDPVMGGMAASLSEQDRLDLAAYYAIQTPTNGNGKASDAGHKFYFGGDEARGITACAACHGANGQGMSQAGFPAVANQNVEYLKTQLGKFRSGVRANDANAMMQNIATKLSDKDIEMISQFMSSL